MFQIRNWLGDVVDWNLSYEEALMWVDKPNGDLYTIEPMDEGDQNDCSSL